MTASSANSKVTTAEKNLSKTTAETRRASKPLMEKRRRARINHSLGILKSLIVDSQRVEGQKHSKLEKADILEMTVAHLNSVNKSDEQKFIEGFEECFSESLRFLEKSKINSSVIDKLADHLKHFQENLDHTNAVHKEDKTMSSVSSSLGTSSTMSIEEEQRPGGRLLTISVTSMPMNGADQGENSNSMSPLQVPRLKLEPSQTNNNNGSSSHSPCLSPSLSISISNDSNHNNFTSEMDGSTSSPPLVPRNSSSQHEFVPSHHANAASIISPISRYSQSGHITGNSMKHDSPYILNLSTTNNTSFHSYPSNSSPTLMMLGNGQVSKLDEPMDQYCEPLDFSKPIPLDLCKHPVGYRLSEDGVWRPW